MLLYINKRLIEFKEDSVLNTFIVNQTTLNNEYTLHRESKGYIFRDVNGNPYRQHFHSAGTAINNALSNGELVMQNEKKISSSIVQIDKKYLIKE